jgi:hypothetical protein
VTFFRRLAAVAVLVAAVVALGVAWEHSGAAGWITPPGPGHGPGRAVPAGGLAHPPPGTVIRPGGRVFRPRPGAAAGLGIGLDFADLGNLSSTAEIEVAVVAGVVVLDIIWRRQRRARRNTR